MSFLIYHLELPPKRDWGKAGKLTSVFQHPGGIFLKPREKFSNPGRHFEITPAVFASNQGPLFLSTVGMMLKLKHGSLMRNEIFPLNKTFNSTRNPNKNTYYICLKVPF